MADRKKIVEVCKSWAGWVWLWWFLLWQRRWQLARFAASVWQVAFSILALMVTLVPAAVVHTLLAIGNLPIRLIDLAERRAVRPSSRPSVPPVDYPADLRNQAGQYLAVRN